MDALSAARASPRLGELFPPEAIRIGLQSSSKPAVIEALVRHAVAMGALPSQEERPVIDTILAREAMASTGLGHGFAMPHCECASLDRLIGVAGFLQRGIPFDALDGEPVDRIFLTLAPPDLAEQCLDVVSRLMAAGRNGSLSLLLRGCRTEAQVSRFLEQIDQPVDGHLDQLAHMAANRDDRGRSDLERMSLTLIERGSGPHPDDLDFFGLTWMDRPPRGRESGRR